MQTGQHGVKAIFDEAAEIDDPEARRVHLEEACAGDADLRRKVDALLQAYADAGSFLETPAVAVELTGAFATADRLRGLGANGPLTEGPGTCIGPYKLLQQIGEGGMGVVYMAEQEKPVRRRVALKIIKPGMDSKQVIARFEAERQALALMDHQNIARVMDAGTTETARPYFVMELVNGVPITKYCDDAQLTPRERLELFVPLCQAIQHAHVKGIIHRDIKPSNVLVTLYDGKPVAKVIDFGVAKATDQRLTERTMFTQYGSVVGTLEYMSPEQAEMSALGVDTRSDIYALGVLLYELLTGSTPLDHAKLREVGYAEILKRIKEEEPPRPSTRLSSCLDTLPSISSQRKTEPGKLAKLMRGELDWIVMKALEKDRSRRYETANAFARDIERHLKDETVEACPPSAGYRLRKFARKHRAAIVTTSAFAVLLLLGAAASTWQAVRATRAENLAILEATRARKAEQQTGTERDKAVTAQRQAEARRQEAESARQSLRRSLYASDIQLAQTAWAAGNVVRMRALLDAHRPRPDEADLRGLEWHYLRRRAATLRVLELAQGRAYGTLSGDGTRLLSLQHLGGVGTGVWGKGELEVWDTVSGQKRNSFPFFPGKAVSTFNLPGLFSPDGRRCAFSALVRDPDGREHSSITTWDCETGRELFSLEDLPRRPTAIAFDAAGKRLAGRVYRPKNEGSDLKVWDTQGGKELLTIPLPDRWPVGMTFSPDGARLAAMTRPAGARDAHVLGEVRVWEAGSGQEVVRFATGPGSLSLQYSPDGNRLAFRQVEASIHLRDARSGEEGLELTGSGGGWRFSFSPDGARLAASSWEGKVRIWDVTAGGPAGSRPPARVLENITPISYVGWSADGRFLTAVDEFRGPILTWDLAPPDELSMVPGPVWAHSAPVASAIAGRFAAVFELSSGESEVRAWDETGKVLFTARDAIVAGARKPDRAHRVGASRIQDALKRVVIDRDGGRVAYWSVEVVDVDGHRSNLGRLRVWDITASREVFHRDGGECDHLYQAALSPDSRLLAASWVRDQDSREPRSAGVSVWDLATGKEVLHHDVPGWARLAFSPDGRRLACVVSLQPSKAKDSVLQVVDIATGALVLNRKWSSFGWLDQPAFSGDATLLALNVEGVAAVGEVKVLDAATGAERHSLGGHRYPIQALAFSPDGHRLASAAGNEGSTEAEVKLWDMVGGRELMTFPATGSSGPGGLAFSPDGRRLSYTSVVEERQDANVQLRVWDATPLPDERPPIGRSLP